MFPLYRIGVSTVCKSSRISSLFTLQHEFAAWYSYRIAVKTQNSQKRDSLSEPAITCLNLTIETLEQSVKYVRS